MKIKVTFEEVFDVQNEEEAYDTVIKYFSEVVEYGDLTTFNFKEVKELHIVNENGDYSVFKANPANFVKWVQTRLSDKSRRKIIHYRGSKVALREKPS